MKISASAIASVLACASLASADKVNLRQLQPALPTLAELASSVDDYSTLYTAVLANPDITALLSDSTAEVTVLGPNNEAFAALPQDLVQALLTPPYQMHLENLLAYHGVSGVYNSTVAASLSGQSVPMLNNEQLTITAVNDTLCFSSPNTGENYFGCVDLPDVEAVNGIFHGINGVLLPNWVFNNLAEVASSNADSFSTLIELVTIADLVGELSTGGPYTILAPTNDAFAALPAETVEALIADPEALQQVLLYHVIPGILPSDLVEPGSITTAEGSPVELVETETGATINGANVIAVDILANNGIIHVIDQVLIPPSDATGSPAPVAATTSPAPVAATTSPAPVASPVAAPTPDEPEVGGANDQPEQGTDPLDQPGQGASSATAVFSAVAVGLTSAMTLFMFN